MADEDDAGTGARRPGGPGPDRRRGRTRGRAGSGRGSAGSGRGSGTTGRGRRDRGVARLGRTGPRPAEVAETLDDPIAVGSPAHGGFVVGRAGPVVTLVRHAIPGEVVRVAVTSRRSRVWFADAVEVVERSRERVPHVWPEAGPGGVGGGELGHVSPAAQLEWKSAVLADSLRRIGGEQVAGDVAAAGSTTVHPVADPALPGTRTRVELTGTEEGRLGMHRYRGQDVLALETLPLADPRLDVGSLLGSLRVDPGARVRAVVGSGPDAEPRVLVDGSPLSGTRSVAESVPTLLGTIDYTVAADGFWQVHHAAPAVLVEVVLALAAGLEPRLPDPAAWQEADQDGAPAGGVDPAPRAGDGSGAAGEVAADPRTDAGADVRARADRVRGALDGARVLELYSGAGLLSAALARAVGADGRLVTLEGAAGAVDDARATLAPTPWARPLTGAVDASAVAALGREPEWSTGGTVVLDPPRTGARGEVMTALAALAPARIVHVACDPAALARDLAAARAAGYVAERVVALDLFPHTHHLEAVVSLVRS